MLLVVICRWCDVDECRDPGNVSTSIIAQHTVWELWECGSVILNSRVGAFAQQREITGEPLNSCSRILAPNKREITGIDCISVTVMYLNIIHINIKPHPSVINELIKPHLSVINELIKPHPSVINELIKPHPSVINELIKPHPSVINELIKSHPSVINELIKPHPSVINELIKPHPSVINELIKPHPSVINELIKPHPSVINELIKPHPSVINELIKPYPSVINELIKGEQALLHVFQGGKPHTSLMTPWLMGKINCHVQCLVFTSIFSLLYYSMSPENLPSGE